MRPTVTLGLAAVTAAAWVVASLGGLAQEAAFGLGFIPARLFAAAPWPALPVWLTPLSATLVHADLFHLVANLLLLVWCGRALERILGAGPVLILYVAGAYAAAAAQVLAEPGSAIPGIGASGAVSALVGAFALSFGKPKPLVRSAALNRALNTLWILVAWVVLQWLLAVLMGLQGVLVSAAAHIGGFIAGVILQKPLLLWRYRKA
jgi:membrane associated rhomboid family serine protease